MLSCMRGGGDYVTGNNFLSSSVSYSVVLRDQLASYFLFLVQLLLMKSHLNAT